MTLEPILEVCHLSKSFGTHQVLRDVNFTVHPGDVTSILGSSGSGKSTLLRLSVSYTHLDVYKRQPYSTKWQNRSTSYQSSAAKEMVLLSSSRAPG